MTNYIVRNLFGNKFLGKTFLLNESIINEITQNFAQKIDISIICVFFQRVSAYTNLFDVRIYFNRYTFSICVRLIKFHIHILRTK